MTATSSVPMKVARGIVRPGSLTRPAGIAALSTPSMAYSASVEAAITADSDSGVGGTCTTGSACGARNAHTPSAMTPTCGTSFSTVVSTCTQPAVRAPRILINTNSQTNDTAVAAASEWLTPSCGKKNDR